MTGWLMRLAVLVLLLCVGLLVLTGYTFEEAAKGFIPQQTRGGASATARTGRGFT